MRLVTMLALLLQGAAALVLLRRLAPGRHRAPAIEPRVVSGNAPDTTIIVPTFNEARRIGPLLERLPLQGALVRAILIVDSGSTDGTRELIERAAARDPRIRLLSDPPVPPGWVGKAWALEHARQHVTTEWILGLDADTVPHPGLAAAVVHAATERKLDVVSFSPRFAGQSAAERFLQPALLTTLVYRTGVPGADDAPRRVLANGQCFLVKRDVLARGGGYSPVRASFAEDVSLARHLARGGARVAFLDGSRLYDVHSYQSAREMWREWGRSVDLSDANPRWRQAVDVVFLTAVQALPLLAVLSAVTGFLPDDTFGRALLSLNVALLAIRVAMNAALASQYERRGPGYWLSPLADPLAVARVLLTTLMRPRSWRGRSYGQVTGTGDRDRE